MTCRNFNPLFTIITVNLNSGQALNDTVLSVLNQNYTDFQYIIKDGISYDSSMKCIEHLRDNRLFVVRRHDSGIYDAMNQALSFAKGKYIHLLNAGDMYSTPDSLKVLAEKIKTISRKKIFYSNFYNAKHNCIVKYPKKLNKFFLFRNNINHQAQFVPNYIYRTIGNFDCRFQIFGDRDFLLRAIIQHKLPCELVSEPIVVYKDGGISAQKVNSVIKKKENILIKKKYFNKIECFIYEYLNLITLQYFRIFLLNTLKNNKIKNIYRKFANIINSSS